MKPNVVGWVAAWVAALGSLITPTLWLVDKLTRTIPPDELADARRNVGPELTAETLRSNQVTVSVAILAGYLVLAGAFLVAGYFAARGGAISAVVMVICCVIGVVMWSGSAIDGTAGWALRGVITVAGILATVLLIADGRHRRTEFSQRRAMAAM
ncbi:hypothetical protein AXK56_00290 [Tsukamurella pulmonis]|uniref:Uncharacterized protein n=1 Tax=Tsukamurella pulmonis TaxID=47312 RepID=A0A1H1AKH2_9ACTN|nr:hypothetical protein [Tsukamurella pulmonis]KXO96026.1 hypothetical protein AXK56_00290 [Tsukamurella pulmonis]SDQ40273.1 hypothetical protein SAMN04489765_0271 [Tsukamurella pulmonis]SUP26486.1 Uncharacterised protein [Tsukamurella pulmonis]